MTTGPTINRGHSKQDYQTPEEFTRSVRHLLGVTKFLWDLAANAENTQAERFFTVEEDALVQPWPQQGWCWLNPPFADIEPWVLKAKKEMLDNVATAMLVPASVGTNWWADHVHLQAQALFVRPRVVFVGQSDPYPRDLALLLYSQRHAIVQPGYGLWEWR